VSEVTLGAEVVDLQADVLDFSAGLLVVAVVRSADLHDSVAGPLVGDGVVWNVALDHLVALLGELSLDLLWLEVLWQLDSQSRRLVVQWLFYYYFCLLLTS
jgi:hypothetical protein